MEPAAAQGAPKYLELEVELESGTVVLERCDAPRGAWGMPSVTQEEHLVKVKDCFRLMPEVAGDVIEMIEGFPELTPTGVRQLMDLLAG